MQLARTWIGVEEPLFSTLLGGKPAVHLSYAVAVLTYLGTEATPKTSGYPY